MCLNSIGKKTKKWGDILKGEWEGFSTPKKKNPQNRWLRLQEETLILESNSVFGIFVCGIRSKEEIQNWKEVLDGGK